MAVQTLLEMGAEDGLEAALERLGRSKKWLAVILLLASSPSIVNTWHLTVYVFWGAALPHWCSVPELSAANWTGSQIHAISNPGGLSEESCTLLQWNYTQLAAMTYEEAMEFTASRPRPDDRPCQHWEYEGNGIVSEWDLVCSRTPLKSTVQMAVSLGKFLGALLASLLADRFGRKRVFVAACFTYMIAGPIASLVPLYTLFIIARIALGMAGSGTHNCGFTLLAEACDPRRRTVLAVLYYLPTAIGMMVLPLIAFQISEWRILQLVISLPAMLFLIHVWFLPESPRWLLTQGRRDESWQIVKKYKPKMCPQHIEAVCTRPVTQSVPISSPCDTKTADMNGTASKWQHVALEHVMALFGHTELRRRLLICYYTTCVSSMSYYVLNLNADNFTANRYIYVGVAGVVELVGYVLPLPLLRLTGRRETLTLLYFLSATALLAILGLPQERTTLIWSVAMIGRLFVGAAYSLIVVQTSELFPTTARNTAISTCSTLAHVGSLSAPFIVDLLGAKAWHIPSTLCGCSLLVAGFMILLLPETKNRSLCDTVEEEMLSCSSNSRYRVSLGNCCSFTCSRSI